MGYNRTSSNGFLIIAPPPERQLLAETSPWRVSSYNGCF
jgi:hypothetical protein